LYVSFSHPANDAKFTEIQVKLDIKKTSLTRLSDTHWNCRVRSCVAVKLNFKAIVTLLNDEIKMLYKQWVRIVILVLLEL